ncbi:MULTISPECIES: MarR family winged helix-turn-helix transcriptional regulator [Pacificibacter]|uniref:MarR family winged helix-turn-helix transcriptional regulator n=1 Tax=Pacificibacter TaxID=1042323 RepID=UPI001C0A5281|nr:MULTISPECIES: MarR family transcriptional regulator [Pacificibacter]MBU2936460.1 MarR family transcriptional regulator [Pacificibacter marinus]MDO6614739.1 MarR family transcriptional regulator [Pacificibacter sp. 1_MG-2023]
MQTESFNFHLLLHSANLVGEQLRQKLADIGVSQSQARVLDALARMGAVSQVTLVREFGITPASMSTMTARLIEAGYISRMVDPAEARSNIVELTPKGRDLLADIYAAWQEIDTLIKDTMGAEDASQLADLTRSLLERLGGKAPSRSAPTDTNDNAIARLNHQ